MWIKNREEKPVSLLLSPPTLPLQLYWCQFHLELEPTVHFNLLRFSLSLSQLCPRDAFLFMLSVLFLSLILQLYILLCMSSHFLRMYILFRSLFLCCLCPFICCRFMSLFLSFAAYISNYLWLLSMVFFSFPC